MGLKMSVKNRMVGENFDGAGLDEKNSEPDDCEHPSLISDFCLVCGKHKKEFVK